MNKRLYKFLTIGTASVSAIAATSFVVSCGTKNSHSSSIASSSDFQSRDVHTMDQFLKDFPNFKGLIINGRLADNACEKAGVKQLPANFYLPDLVNEIGLGAFKGVTINDSFEFPYAIQIINKYAFQGAKLPKGFTIPKEMRSIASYAFANIKIPSGFSLDIYSKPFTISPLAFDGVQGFEDGAKISLTTFFGIKTNGAKDSIVASDGRGTANGNIDDWSFPVKLTTIPNGAFHSANIPTSDKVDGKPGFFFPSWVSKIGATAFYQATLPKNFTINLTTSVQGGSASIDSMAFQDATLQSGFKIVRNEGSLNVDGMTFYGAHAKGLSFDKYTYDKLIAGGINLQPKPGGGLEGTRDEVLPSASKVENLDSVLIQGGDKDGWIKPFAFEGVDFANDNGAKAVLQEIMTSSKVKGIDYSAFAHAKFGDPKDPTTKFVLPASLTKIGISAFEGAEFAYEFEIPNTVTSIEESAFSNAKGTSLVFDANTTTVASSLFSVSEKDRGFANGITFGSHALTTVKTIGGSAFNGVNVQSGFALPTSISVIGERAFAGATFAGDFTFPSVNIELKEEVFSGATLKTIDMSPATIVKMGDGIFNSATFTSFKWPQGTKSVARNMFFKVNIPTGFTIPDTVTSIGEYAFSGADIYTAKLTLSGLHNLKEIGKSAFAGNGPTADPVTGISKIILSKIPSTFELPSTLTTIQNTAFQYTDWSDVHGKVLGDLSADFSFDHNGTSTTKGILGSAVFLGAKMNNEFELPASMDYIPSSFFQQAVFQKPATGTELGMVKVNFSHIKAIASSAFQGARITFKLDGLTSLNEIYNSAFREAKIDLDDLSTFKIPFPKGDEHGTYKTYGDGLFFAANADTTEKVFEYNSDGTIKVENGVQVQKVDEYNNPVFKSRTIDWTWSRTDESPYKNGNPQPGTHAVLSTNDYYGNTNAPVLAKP